MKVQGETAKGYSAVRLDSHASVEGTGVLTSADTDTGEVKWRDKTDTDCALSLGAGAIYLIRRQPHGR